MASYLQWNIPGLKANFEELTMLFKKFNVQVMAIQDSKLSGNEAPPADFNCIAVRIRRGELVY